MTVKKKPSKKTSSKKTPPKKMGRPRIPVVTPDIGDGEGKIPPRPINFEEVYYWMDLGATQEEIAGAFRVSVDTLGRRIKEHTGLTFAELKEKVCGGAKITLRKNQINLSKTNASMAIWLGKHWLGQIEETDKNKDQMVQTFSELFKIASEGKLKELFSQKDDE